MHHAGLSVPHKPSVVAYTCSLSTQEVEAGESDVQSHLHLQSKFKVAWAAQDTETNKHINKMSELEFSPPGLEVTD